METSRVDGAAANQSRGDGGTASRQPHLSSSALSDNGYVRDLYAPRSTMRPVCATPKR